MLASVQCISARLPFRSCQNEKTLGFALRHGRSGTADECPVFRPACTIGCAIFFSQYEWSADRGVLFCWRVCSVFWYGYHSAPPRLKRYEILFRRSTGSAHRRLVMSFLFAGNCPAHSGAVTFCPDCVKKRGNFFAAARAPPAAGRSRHSFQQPSVHRPPDVAAVLLPRPA